jgi:hypothetical protein
MDAAELCIERHFTADRLNELANHPQVRPTCGGDGQSELDFSLFVASSKNHALVWDRGAILFFWSAPETYEIHVMVLPEGRGRESYRMIAEGIDCMIANGAERLWARVEKRFGGLRHLTTHAGLVRCGTDVLDIGFGPVTYDLFQWKQPCRQRS